MGKVEVVSVLSNGADLAYVEHIERRIILVEGQRDGYKKLYESQKKSIWQLADRLKKHGV